MSSQNSNEYEGEDSFVVLGSSPSQINGLEARSIQSITHRSIPVVNQARDNMSINFCLSKGENVSTSHDNSMDFSMTISQSLNEAVCNDCVKHISKRDVQKLWSELKRISGLSKIEINRDVRSIFECNKHTITITADRFKSINDDESKLIELTEENNVLRQTLRRNNASIREQFKAIETWRDDVMKTHELHKIKFIETKKLVNKLKTENNALKQEIDVLKKCQLKTFESIEEESVTLYPKLEELKKENSELIEEIKKLKEEKVIEANMSQKKIKEMADMHAMDINQAEETISTHQKNLTETSVKLLQSENVKVEFTKYKLDTEQKIRNLANEVQDLRSKLRDALKLILGPLKTLTSPSMEEDEKNAQYNNLIKNLSRIINYYIDEFLSLDTVISDLHAQLLNSIDSDSVQKVKRGLESTKHKLCNIHISVAENNIQLKEIFTVIENLLMEYENTKKNLEATSKKLNTETAQRKVYSNELSELRVQSMSQNETIQNKEADLMALREVVKTLQKESEERDHLREQINAYKSDFEDERNARTNLAAEKQQLLDQIRNLMRSRQPKRSSISLNDFEYDMERETSPPPAVFVCPVCQNDFSNGTELQNHVEICLDRNN